MKGNRPSIMWLPARRARYRCAKCRFEWAGLAGPVSCPECGHLYVVWIDYRP
jgi:rubrerythrin